MSRPIEIGFACNCVRLRHGVRIELRYFHRVDRDIGFILLTGVADGCPRTRPSFFCLGYGGSDQFVGLVHNIVIAGNERLGVADLVVEGGERSVFGFFGVVRRITGMTDDLDTARRVRPVDADQVPANEVHKPRGLSVGPNAVAMMELYLIVLLHCLIEQGDEGFLLEGVHAILGACESNLECSHRFLLRTARSCGHRELIGVCLMYPMRSCFRILRRRIRPMELMTSSPHSVSAHPGSSLSNRAVSIWSITASIPSGLATTNLVQLAFDAI